MILIDSDIFVIDRRYPRDKKYSVNRAFLDYIKKSSARATTTIFNVHEVCGIMSFNLNPQQLLDLLRNFKTIYGIRIIHPKVPGGTSKEVIKNLLGKAFAIIQRKVGFQDSLVISAGESEPNVKIMVTWNARHFQGKTKLDVKTPKEYLIAEGVSI